MLRASVSRGVSEERDVAQMRQCCITSLYAEVLSAAAPAIPRPSTFGPKLVILCLSEGTNIDATHPWRPLCDRSYPGRPDARVARLRFCGLWRSAFYAR